MNTSEEYHQPVHEVLSAFVRDGTRPVTGDGSPATDIQATLTVIGRRVVIEKRVPDLSLAHVPIADLIRAGVSGADVRHALIEPRQLVAACGANVKLDPGLTIKPC